VRVARAEPVAGLLAVDYGETLFYNREDIGTLRFNQLVGAIAHEVLHSLV